MSTPFHHHKPLFKSGLRNLGHTAAGFIQGVILFGIALLAVVIAAFSFSNKSTSTSTAAEEAKTMASTIIVHGGSIRAATDRFSIDRGGLNNMTFNVTSNGLFNTTDNFIISPTVQGKAYTTAPALSVTDVKNNYFYLKKGSATSANAVTVGGNSVHLTTTGPLTEAVCLRININLHGSNAPSAIPVVTDATAAEMNGTSATGFTITGSGATGTPHFPNVIGLEEGCVRITSATGEFWYFKVIGRFS